MALTPQKPESTVVRLKNATKTFQLFSTRFRQALHTMGLPRFVWRRGFVVAKTALSDVNLSIKAGEKVGVIGHNGSGKTTLLNLIIGRTRPTSGQVHIDGNIQALMATGAGIVEELSGSECIKNSLILNGLSRQEERGAYDEIVDFVELGDFIAQPVRTYSLGMRARLEFAIATAIKPDILAIDEVLGAGDGYFARKCATRIHTLAERSTLLLVSHSMQQILNFCDRAIWLNDGRIVEDGAPATVIKAYESYMVRRDASIQATTGADELPLGGEQTIDLGRQEASLDTRKSPIQQKSEDLLGKREPIDNLGPSLLWAAFEPSGEPAYSIETGGSVCIRVRVRVPDRLRRPLSLSVVAFSENGSPMWRSHELALPDAGGEYDALLSTEQVIAGVGGYFLSICLRQGKDGDRALIDVKHACLRLQLVTTNYSDPPLFHCPAQWRYGKAPGVVVDGRVSGWV